MRAVAADGTEYTFLPSFARIASLGGPKEIVGLYAGLHGPRAAQDAAYVLATLCEQDDPTPLIGGVVIDPNNPEAPARIIPAAMPEGEQIAIALHLMQHGTIGTAKPNQKSSGGYSDSFKASEYIAAACVHLGLTRADAEQLSMTEFQTMFEMKFPSKADGKRDVPTREEYQASMAAIEGRRNV